MNTVTNAGIRQADEGPRLFSIDETCERLGIKRTALYQILATGELKTVKAKGIGRKVKSDELARYIDSLPDADGVA